MRRPVAIAALLGLVAVLASVGSSSAAPAKPILRFADLSPLVVRGQHFRPAELVRLTVRVDGALARTRRTRASRAGTFGMSFGEISVDRCNAGIGVTAVGSRGSRAALKAPQPDCPPPLPPPGG